uniref:VWA domain-containing protein n=1 Tax=Schlesneria paludicola TaxID=360056 RepID=A0A7C4LQ87_9PLAN
MIWTNISPVSWPLAETATALSVREFDWPDSPLGWLLLLGGSLLVAAWVVWQYRRDTRDLSRGWTMFLAVLRLAVLAGLLVIALNPQERTQRTAFRPSRVALLVDTSLSMGHPVKLPAATADASETRAAAVRRLLMQEGLLERLRRDHEVSLYTFDAALVGPQRVWPPADSQPAPSNPNAEQRPESASEPAADDWSVVLEPRGLETRLGEALNELIRQSAGRTLSGIVVLTDGGQNAGIDPVTAHDRALAAKARLIAVGVGSTEQPINVQLAEVQSPTDVQLGDRFEIAGFVQGQGLAGRELKVELLASEADAEEAATVVGEHLLTLPQDGAAAEVRFPVHPAAAGRWTYALRVTAASDVPEFNTQDNQQTLTVNVFDRPTRVLLVAGGPMRDYQFVRNLIHRHKSMEVDVLLQTASVGSSQESRQLLFQFPTQKEQLFQYDVVIAFDVDWQMIPGEGIQLLSEWVANEGGGLILVAGDVHTGQLALLGGGATPMGDSATPDQLLPLKELYPVVLNSYLAELRFDQTSGQPWPLVFTPEGQRAEFLQLTDDPLTSLARWKEFPGFYRCYPTAGAKAGATVLARFSDPRSQNEYGFPIVLAEQFYGQGRTLYLGSAEMWRLRAVSEGDYDRFWIKAIREVGQGRSKRGAKRGVLLPEARKLLLGQTARIRARLLDAQFEPLELDSVPLDVLDPTGKPLVPTPRLIREETRPGEFVGEFRISLPGVYRLSLAIPDGREQLTEELTAALPKLESQDLRQNVTLLQDLVRDTGGAYVPLDEALDTVPGLLPPRGEPFTIEERLRALWDRDWVLYLLVGLLSVEWLTRKLLKLA